MYTTFQPKAVSLLEQGPWEMGDGSARPPQPPLNENLDSENTYLQGFAR